MIRIDNLVAKYNTEFVLNVAAIKKVVASGKVINFNDKTTLYELSNRCEQVAQMFELRDRGYITPEQNRELQARTKGYAIDKVAAFMKRCKAAGIGAPVVDNSAELKALRAQLAAKDAQIAELQSENKELKSAVSVANRTIRNKDKALEVVATKLEKVTNKLNNMWSIKVAQAAYMQVTHGIIQKVRG